MTGVQTCALPISPPSRRPFFNGPSSGACARIRPGHSGGAVRVLHPFPMSAGTCSVFNVLHTVHSTTGARACQFKFEVPNPQEGHLKSKQNCSAGEIFKKWPCRPSSAIKKKAFSRSRMEPHQRELAPTPGSRSSRLFLQTVPAWCYFFPADWGFSLLF